MVLALPVLLMLGVLLVVLALPLLLLGVLLAVLALPLLLLGVLLAVLALPLLLLGVLLAVLALPRLIALLFFGLGLLFALGLLVVLLLALCVTRSRDSENRERHKCRMNNSESFHKLPHLQGKRNGVS